MNNLDTLGRLIDELHVKIETAHSQGRFLWEEKLRLHLRPKPAWCPPAVWQKLVCLVLVQSIERHIE